MPQSAGFEFGEVLFVEVLFVEVLFAPASMSAVLFDEILPFDFASSPHP